MYSLLADDDAGLGSAQQLVAAEGDHVGAGGQAVVDRGLVRERRQLGQHAAAEVVDDDQPAFVPQLRPGRR